MEASKRTEEIGEQVYLGQVEIIFGFVHMHSLEPPGSGVRWKVGGALIMMSFATMLHDQLGRIVVLSPPQISSLTSVQKLSFEPCPHQRTTIPTKQPSQPTKARPTHQGSVIPTRRPPCPPTSHFINRRPLRSHRTLIPTKRPLYPRRHHIHPKAPTLTRRPPYLPNLLRRDPELKGSQQLRL